MSLVERLNDEADLCKNEGADDVASLLWEAAAALGDLPPDGTHLFSSQPPPPQVAPARAQPTSGEALFLVHAGGDGYQAEIVPESKLDDAYLLTQWGSLDDICAEERVAALEHFHDDDSWTHEEASGAGRRIGFSLSLEDGWIEVVRLPA